MNTVKLVRPFSISIPASSFGEEKSMQSGNPHRFIDML